MVALGGPVASAILIRGLAFCQILDPYQSALGPNWLHLVLGRVPFWGIGWSKP